MAKDQREKLEEEKKIFYDFGQAILNATKNNQTFVSPEDAEYYRAEYKAMSQVVRSSFTKGLLAGAVSFVGLRWIRRGATRWFSRRAKPYDVRGQLEAKTFAETRANGNSPFHHEGPNFQNPWIKVFHFTTDVLTSMFVTIFVTYQCFDLNKALPTLARMPLVEGRSRVAETLCENVVKEMKKHPPEFWEGIQHPRMKAIAQMGWNCERRWAYEKFLLKQGGHEHEKDMVVVIPPPGVPPSFPINGETQDESEPEFEQYWFPKESDGKDQDDLMDGLVSDNETEPKWR